MLNKFMLFMIIIVYSCYANAECAIDMGTNNNLIGKLLNENGFPIKEYDKLCARLKKANAKLYIMGNGSVLEGRAIGVAYVGVSDSKLPIVSMDWGATRMHVNNNASQDSADKLLHEAVIAGVNWLYDNQLDKALSSLEKARVELRKSLGK